MKPGDTFKAKRRRNGEYVKRMNSSKDDAVFVYDAFHRQPATMKDSNDKPIMNEWITCFLNGKPRQLFTRLFDFEIV